MHRFDTLIVGAGIAGASLAYHVENPTGTAILEGESQPGYHSTGRSAATYIESYGPRPIRALTVASGPFLRDPPAGFASTPLATPLGVLLVAGPDALEGFPALIAELRESSSTLREITPEECVRRCPVLRPETVAAACFESAALALDVHAIHQGYLRAARARGVTLVNDARATSIARREGLWRIHTPAGEFAAPVLVDAAGAWADQVASLAGATPVGLSAKRRTMVVVDAPDGSAPETWPLVADAAEHWYFKPDASRLMASPADETPVPPQDVQPEEMDIALAVERLQAVTTIRVRRILRSWAGLRSFVSDKCPVVGFAPEAEGFFWLAGQGGYGIQTSWALGLAAARLLGGHELPREIRSLGVTESVLAPGRALAR